LPLIAYKYDIKPQIIKAAIAKEIFEVIISLKIFVRSGTKNIYDKEMVFITLKDKSLQVSISNTGVEGKIKKGKRFIVNKLLVTSFSSIDQI
jgi:hypothetical protein|tara:strand:+ start:6989 stop:7264 length:276 start_codon:yes stop_codon:yes gene_type:complete